MPPTSMPAWVPDIRHARNLVIDALLCEDRVDRYLRAHQAVALAADAAVLARTGRRLPEDLADPWGLVARSVPGLAEWATYFSATQRRRQAVRSGRLAISEREADDMVRDADQFCDLALASASSFSAPRWEEIDQASIRIATGHGRTRSAGGAG